MAEYDASNRKHIRAAEKAAAIAERERAEVVVEMMATVPRRRYVWEKLADAHIFSTTFSTDPIQMAFNEGQRNQGLALLDEIIRSCPDQFILAMRESNARRTESDARTSLIPDTGSGDTGQRIGGEEPGWEPEGEPGPDSLAGSEAA